MPRLLRFPTVASTMDLLHGLAADGAEAGTLVVAGEQTGGRGSRGRGWQSPPGGLWLSTLYRPRVSTGVELFGLRVGLAVAEAVEALGPGVEVRIKWPNDLMIDDRKLGGILCEARWQGESLAWVVAGVGINVANSIPAELSGIAIALADRLPGVSPDLLESEVTPRLRALDSGSERLGLAELAGIRHRDWLQGRRLSSPADGRAAGISEEGALLVRTDGGALVAIRVGTVQLDDHSFTP